MNNSPPTIADKRKTFRKLHDAGCFVIPNPWNVGSARYLQGLGFKALATTAKMNLHVMVPYGNNNHHIAEAIFKATAKALRQAVSADPRNSGVPSTKGTL